MKRQTFKICLFSSFVENELCVCGNVIRFQLVSCWLNVIHRNRNLYSGHRTTDFHLNSFLSHNSKSVMFKENGMKFILTRV